VFDISRGQITFLDGKAQLNKCTYVLSVIKEVNFKPCKLSSSKDLVVGLVSKSALIMVYTY